MTNTWNFRITGLDLDLVLVFVSQMLESRCQTMRSKVSFDFQREGSCYENKFYNSTSDSNRSWNLDLVVFSYGANYWGNSLVNVVYIICFNRLEIFGWVLESSSSQVDAMLSKRFDGVPALRPAAGWGSSFKLELERLNLIWGAWFWANRWFSIIWYYATVEDAELNKLWGKPSERNDLIRV